MINYKRLTPQKIKLAIKGSGEKMRVYNLNNDIAVQFDHVYQANTYYTRVMIIDVNTSKIIPNDTYNEDSIENINSTYIAIRIDYRTIKLLNGMTISMDRARESLNNYIVLQDNNQLYRSICTTINRMREIHSIVPADFKYDRTDNYDVISYNPVNAGTDTRWMVRATRPYHTARQNVVGDSSNNYIQMDIASVSTSASAYTTTTASEEPYRDLRNGYHGGTRAGWHKYTGANESPSYKTRYFGIELETELTQRNIAEYTCKINDFVNGSRRDLGKYIKFEEDGSLSGAVPRGCEIITEPMTYAFLAEHKGKIKDTTDLITSLGGTSHDNGRCGLHVHVSRSSLTPTGINYIYQIVETFKSELIAFSRRITFSYCAFNSFSNLQYDNIKYIDKDYWINHKTTGHGSAMNNSNMNTLEFRFIRGTLNTTTILASVQLVDNICNMAEDLAAERIAPTFTWDDLINYNDNYEEIKQYVRSKHITSGKVFNEVLDITRSDR